MYLKPESSLPNLNFQCLTQFSISFDSTHISPFFSISININSIYAPKTGQLLTFPKADLQVSRGQVVVHVMLV